MPNGICRLCRREADLQLSHIIPAFVFRWLRESSGTGHIRSSAKPNLRVQDGPQEHWLCAECEARIGRSETAFATNIFHPYLATSGNRLRYGPWLLHFCASVSWRNLLYQLEHLSDTDFSEDQRKWIEQAESIWRQYLLGEAPHPGPFRQHILPLDRIGSSSMDLPPNINRYFTRAIDIDLCHGGDMLFTYTKLGRFVVLGFINEPNPSNWVGTKVNANEGTIEPRRYVLPAPFGSYLMDKANRVRESQNEISDKQRSKIEQTFRSNIERISESDFFDAMQADIDMFGDAAFINPEQNQGDR